MLLFRALSFRVLIGGAASSSCEQVDDGEDVVVEYQADGSSEFIKLILLGNIGENNVTHKENTVEL